MTATEPRTLFVAWQSARTRRYYPVGRLLFGAGPTGDHYEFAYTHGADIARDEGGFTPFPAFSDAFNPCHRVYRSADLPAFFANRLMSPGRPDYPDYLRRLDLDPATADPFDILARSGGARATDAVELFARPEPVESPGHGAACFETHFLLHGIRHLQSHEQARVLQLTAGDALHCQPQPDNPDDPAAMLLLTVDSVRAGWLPRYLAPDAHLLSRWCGSLDVRVVQVNQPPAPTTQRVLCRLRACWPPGFQPFASEAFEPIPSAATVVKPPPMDRPRLAR